MTDIATIIGLISGVSGVMIAIFTARSSVSKTELDSLRNTITSLQATITTLQGENGRLIKRLCEIEDAAVKKDNTIRAQASEIETLHDQVDELRAQIDEMSRRRTRKA